MYQQTQLHILCTYRPYLYVYVHEVHHLRWTKLEVNHHIEQIPYMLKTWWMGRLADSTPQRSIFLRFSQKIRNNFQLFSINLRFCLKFETPICTSSFKSRGYTLLLRQGRPRCLFLVVFSTDMIAENIKSIHMLLLHEALNVLQSQTI